MNGKNLSDPGGGTKRESLRNLVGSTRNGVPGPGVGGNQRHTKEKQKKGICRGRLKK